jgi:hypothetical protein
MTVRGGGIPTCFLGFQCRKGEWVRRFGASLPMRMTASWFGSLDPPNTRLWRDRSAPESGLPSDRHPDRTSVPSCSKLSRYGLASSEHAARLVRRPTLTASARDDVSEPRVRMKKRALRSNKETDEGQKICRSGNSLTKKAPYKETAGGVTRSCVRRYGDFDAGGVLPRCDECFFGRRPMKRRARSAGRDMRNRSRAAVIERHDGYRGWREGEPGHCWSRAGEADGQSYDFAAHRS